MPQLQMLASYKKQIQVVLYVSLGPFAAGLSIGYVSPAITSMENPIYCGGLGISDQQASWITSLSLLGAFFGALLVGLGLRMGRRTVLMVTAFPYAVAWLVTALSTNIPMVSAAFFFGGMLVSCIMMSAQIYVTEIANAEIRGRLCSILEILTQLGILISFSMGAYFSWNKLALFIASASVLFLIAQFFIPETPSSLLLRNKEQKAKESLQWLRGPNADIESELYKMKFNISSSKLYKESNFLSRWNSSNESPDSSGIRFRWFSNSELDTERDGWETGNLITKYNNTRRAMLKRLFKPLLLACGLMFFRRFTGADFFIFYAVNVFQKTFWSINPHVGAIGTSIVQLLASCASGLLVDKVGRRPLLLLSGGMMTVALAGFGTYSHYKCLLAVSGFYDWIPLVCVFTLVTAYSLGIGPVSSLLIVELLPLENRSTGSALATGFGYFCGFVNMKTSVDIYERIGLSGLFWMYAGVSVLYVLFIFFFVPETKGKEIDEMNVEYVEYLFNSIGVDDALRYVKTSTLYYDEEHYIGVHTTRIEGNLLLVQNRRQSELDLMINYLQNFNNENKTLDKLHVSRIRDQHEVFVIVFAFV